MSETKPMTFFMACGLSLAVICVLGLLLSDKGKDGGLFAVALLLAIVSILFGAMLANETTER